MGKVINVNGIVLCKSGLNTYEVRLNYFYNKVIKCKNKIKGFKRLLPGDEVRVHASSFEFKDAYITERIK